MSYRYLTSVFSDQNASPITSCASKKKNKRTQIILGGLLKEEVYVALAKSSAYTHRERRHSKIIERDYFGTLSYS